jgi:hypothetical protein
MSEAFQIAEPGNRDFLNAIFDGLAPDEYLWTAQFKSSPAKANAEQWAGLEVTERYENRQAAHTGWNHYFCVSALKPDLKGERRRKKGNFSRLFCVVLDDAQPIDELEPTWVLETSRKADGQSNTQVGYRLSVPVDDVDLAVRIHQALGISGHLGADKNGNNAVRYVRLPWGANTKYDPPHHHHLLHWAPESTVDVMALVAALKLDLSAVAGAGQVTPSAPIAGIIENTEEWIAKARKIAWDGALRTHNDPALGRNQEIFRLGAYAARDRLPSVALEFILQEFAARMRPTNTSGELAPINWINERATIQRGYNQGHADGVPPLIDLGAFCAKSNGPEIAESPHGIKAVDAPTAPLYVPTPIQLREFPAYLIEQAPGIIGHLTQWGLRTAQKPQPQLALQAAIATAMTAMTRRYRTNRNNWPVLWFLGIALSASGKEHGKTMVEEALSAGGLGHLIAGAGYTSPGAVFSTLIDKPAHIIIIDEYGKLVESAQAKGNQVKADAITMLMEVFGRAHGTLRPANYSLMALSKEQRQALASRVVCKPAILMLAMTTPSTFYGSLSRQWIADGFLGRLFVTESPIGRAPSLYPDHEPTPDLCVDWMRAVSLQGERSDAGNLAFIETPSELEPTPILMTFSPEAQRSIRAFERDIIDRTNAAERDGLEALYGRTVEKSMRLAMGVCLAEGAENRIITASHMQYAIEYAAACDMALVESVRSNVSDSDFGRIKNRCLEIMRTAGARGVTPRELARRCSAFDAMKPREQGEVFEALNRHGLADLVNIDTPGGRGKKRVAWVALAEEPDDDAQSE